MLLRTRISRPVLAALAAFVLALASLTQTAVSRASAAAPGFKVRPGTTQLEVLHATPGQSPGRSAAGRSTRGAAWSGAS